MATIKDVLAGQVLALCARNGAALMSSAELALEFARDAEACGSNAVIDSASQNTAEVRIERGQRFAVVRGLAVVPVRGILTPNSEMLERWLGWATYDGLIDTMAQLDANEDVHGIILDFDTPGGMVLRCSAAAEAIARVGKPVHGLVNPLAASAGYWLASQCRDITMTSGSVVGSIGVIAGTRDPVQPGMSGYLETVMRSSHARGKNPDASTDEGRGLLQQDVDAAEARFHQAVAAGRGLDVAALPDLLSATDDPRDGGGVFEAEGALARDLVDVTGADRSAFYAAMLAEYAPAPSRGSRGRARAAQARAAQARAAI